MQQVAHEPIIAAWTAAWDRGDVEALEAHVTPDYRRIGSNSEGGLGIDEVKAEIREIRAAFPDMRTRVERVLVEGSDIAIFWTSTGTFTEPLLGVPPTGSRVNTRGSNIMELRGGRLAIEKVTWDASELLADLGVPSLKSAFEANSPDTVDPLDPEIVKAFNRQFVTGVTVVTVTDREGRPRGLAVNSYSSVSLDPPLMLVCVQKTAGTHAALFQSDHFGINILS